MALETALIEAVVGTLIKNLFNNVSRGSNNGRIGNLNFGAGYSNLEIMLHSGAPPSQQIREYLPEPINTRGYRFKLNMKTTGLWRKKLDTGMEIYIEGFLQGPLCYSCGKQIIHRKKVIDTSFIFKSSKTVVECSHCGHHHEYIEDFGAFTKAVAKDMKKIMRRSLGI